MRLAVAGLDLSLRGAGIAIIDKSGGRHCFTIGVKLDAKAGQKEKLKRLLMISSFVVGKVSQHAVSEVAYEDYAFSGSRLTPLAELVGAIKTQVYLASSAVQRTFPIPLKSGEARKFVFGRDIGSMPKGSRAKGVGRTADRKAIKTAVMDGLKGLGIIEPSNPDEADAMVLALVMDAFVNGREKHFEEHHLDVFERMHARS